MKRKKLITILFLLLAIGLLLWLNVPPKNQQPNGDKKTREARINNACLMTYEQAIAATKEFTNKIGLAFQGSPLVKATSLSNVDYPGIRNLKEVIYKNPSGKIKVRFYVG